MYKLLIIGLLSLFLSVSSIAKAHTNTIPSNTITYTIPQEFGSYEQWESIINTLPKLPANTIVNLYISGVGGDLLTEDAVQNSIKLAQQHGVVFNGILTGPTISAHALFICSLNNIQMLPGSSLTFHNGGQIEQPIPLVPIFYKKYIDDPEFKILFDKELQQCQLKGFVNSQDIEAIYSGKRVIVTNLGAVNQLKLSKQTIDDWDRETPWIHIKIALILAAFFTFLLK